MAVLGMDGFDVYNGVGSNLGLGSKWTASGTVALATGRFGGQAVQMNSGTKFIRRTVNPVAINSGTIAFAFQADNLNAATNIICIIEQALGSAQMHIGITNTGAIGAYRSTVAAGTSGGTLLGSLSAAGVIKPETWHFIEVTFTINDTTGSVTIKVDGVSVYTVSSVDTKFSATAGWANFLLAVTAATTIVTFDDVYWTDGASLGERRVQNLKPTGDVSGATDFTPLGGGTHYSEVDEVTADGDTSYVQGSVVGNVDRYTFEDLPLTATVDAVQINAFAMKTDAASRSIALQVKSSSTTSDGSDNALAASYGKFERLLTVDPNGSAAWTPAAVNALEAGVKVTV